MNNLLTEFNGIKDIKKGSLVLLAARPFFSKTAFSYNIAYNMINNNQKVKIYSFERNKEEIEEIIKIISKQESYNQNNLTIDYNLNNTLESIINNSRNYDLIIIETLQKFNIQPNEINKLKELAINNNCVVILISELPSEIDEREDKQPLLTDLNSQIIDNVDKVLFMYGDYYYNKKYTDKMIIELTIIDIKTNKIKKYKLLKKQDRYTFTNYNE